MRIQKRFVAPVAVLIGLALPASAGAGESVEVKAKLNSRSEVPGPGDRNGSGKITIFLDQKKNKACFFLDVKRLDGMSAAHIHKGRKNRKGPVKVTLFRENPQVPGTGSYSGCAKHVNGGLLKKIGRRPKNFYVNVHSDAYPDGAIRGQLR